MSEKSRNYAKAKAIEKTNKERLLKLNPKLNDHGGIYFLIRQEDGLKYAYIGQSRESNGILTRLAQHMVGYSQHIDLSLRKHGLYDAVKNPTGWRVEFLNFPDRELDEKEQYYIKQYANAGYQLRNVSKGSQSAGRTMINETKERKGYRQGVLFGRSQMAKEIKSILDKHLTVSIREDKKNNKVSQRMYEKFFSILDEEYKN